QQSRPSSGGFPPGLFGGGARDEPAPSQSGRPAGWGETRFSNPAAAAGDMRPGMAPAAAAAPSRASGFLGGALQTAAAAGAIPGIGETRLAPARRAPRLARRRLVARAAAEQAGEEAAAARTALLQLGDLRLDQRV
ncbi:hypothetical protein ACV332_30260, partial [Pseudomonas aeruginosa]